MKINLENGTKIELCKDGKYYISIENDDIGWEAVAEKVCRELFYELYRLQNSENNLPIKQ